MKKIGYILFFCILFLPSSRGQIGISPKEPVRSQNKCLMYNVWLTGNWSKTTHNGFQIANNTYNSNNYNLSDTWFNLSFAADIFVLRNKYIPRLFVGLGYQNEWYAYDDAIDDNSGFSSHWLTFDFNLRYVYFSAGMKTNCFLASHFVSNDNFSYLGVNPNCFNPIAYCYYVGVFIQYSYVDLHFRVGSWLKTELNPDKLAYYNITGSRIDGLFWEVSVSFRLFSSGNNLMSASIF